MDYRCTDCRWSTDDHPTNDPSAAAIRHHVETGHSVEQHRTITPRANAEEQLESPSD